MSTGQEQLVVALFHERGRAENALHALQQAGFTHDQLGVVVRHDDTITSPEMMEQIDEEAEATSTGVAVGSVAGGLTGLLGGLALSVIPGIGPFLGVGVLATTLGGVAAGAAAGEAIGEWAAGHHHFGVPPERAQQYTSAVEAGQIAVSVHAHSAGEVMRAREILGAHDADEIDVYDRTHAPLPPQSQDLDAGL
jgi:hypothetical protein